MGKKIVFIGLGVIILVLILTSIFNFKNIGANLDMEKEKINFELDKSSLESVPEECKMPEY